MNLSLGDRPVRFVYPTIAPLAASFASLRRIECSTSTAGERLKCVRPSLSNSATSLTCIVVTMGSPLIRADNNYKGQTNYCPSKGHRDRKSGLHLNRIDV